MNTQNFNTFEDKGVRRSERIRNRAASQSPTKEELRQYTVTIPYNTSRKLPNFTPSGSTLTDSSRNNSPARTKRAKANNKSKVSKSPVKSLKGISSRSFNNINLMELDRLKSVAKEILAVAETISSFSHLPPPPPPRHHNNTYWNTNLNSSDSTLQNSPVGNTITNSSQFPFVKYTNNNNTTVPINDPVYYPYCEECARMQACTGYQMPVITPLNPALTNKFVLENPLPPAPVLPMYHKTQLALESDLASCRPDRYDNTELLWQGPNSSFANYPGNG